MACLGEKKITVNGKDLAHIDKLLALVEENIGSVPNLTKLLGLNRCRGGSKHFGNTVDKHSAKDFLYKTQEAIDFLVLATFGKHYHEIFSAELIKHPESRALLLNGAKCLEIEPLDAFRCLQEIRKAIFINFEEEFSIEEWQADKLQDLWRLMSIKCKAPLFTRRKEWIDENVKDVFDFIQIDNNTLRIELVEYGISVADFFNVLRLTPKVFRHKGKKEWKTEGKFAYMHIEKETLEYCLSTAVDSILMKENYHALHRYEPDEIKMEIVVTTDTNLYLKACKNSRITGEIKKGEKFQARSIIPSISDDSVFVKIAEFRKYPQPEFIKGYLLEDHVTPVFVE